MNRSDEQVREHYDIEKELAAKLLNSTKEERRHLYTEVYDEMFRRVPHHPMLTKKQDPKAKQDSVMGQVRLLKGLIKPGNTYLEIGAGDCLVALEMCAYAEKVYGVDISEELTKGLDTPENFKLIISDGTSISVPENSVDVVFSNQLMEHLHPGDAVTQLRNIYTALAPKGCYLCITPNRVSGPHDISRLFSNVAEGFHLKEYNYKELVDTFKQAGFKKIKVSISARGVIIKLPVLPFIWLESIIWSLPEGMRKWFSRLYLPDKLLGIELIAEK